MAIIHEIPAESRKDEGKGASRRLRHAGKVPAIVYGAHQDPQSIQIHHNTVSQNGFYGNPTNGDLAELSSAEPDENSNCWYANKHPDGSAPTTDPPGLQSLHGKAQCGQTPQSGADSGALLAEAGCDSRALLGPCTPVPGINYPQPGEVRIHKLPREQSMPNPCRGVPSNPWCPGGGHHARHRASPPAPGY